MAQGDDVGRYLYWSDHCVRAVAEEVGLALERGWQWSFTLSLPMTQLQIGEGNRARNRLLTAQRILRRLGSLAATAFDVSKGRAEPERSVLSESGHRLPP
ncbi:hypothetical protein ACTWJ9_07210 [Streptomyces sp. GDS52]|uniref:hypothetical protein n=1 Tax=Streptomyces sp. GDS52 TaxID=3406419 RepID=UPI003FD6915F